MSTSAVLELVPLGFPWPTFDPFLFCAHHLDHYPRGADTLGPDPALLSGRRLGMDFEIRDGFRMYHGGVVPGFPRHPHRGFETVTLARSGVVDHTDSMGAQSRFGHGDVQWMTAGSGIVHAEMFPLLDPREANPLELFQVWLNLPAEDKMVPSHFAMFWRADIPVVRGPGSEIAVIAGSIGDVTAPAPPPHSWAARPEAHVGIWTIRLEPGGRATLPAAVPDASRTLYFFSGDVIAVDGQAIDAHTAIRVAPDAALEIESRGAAAELLVLEGCAIGEPVVQHGPFVMGSRAEIARAIDDYQRTGFGPWPFDRDDPHHGRSQGRFAVHADGRRETPDEA